MEDEFLYVRIAESIRREINSGMYIPGDAIPSIRTISDKWNCTNGTVQRAIRELESAGLVSTHVGKRTRVIGITPLAPEDSLQRANLIHRAETFLLESMTAGFTPPDVEDAFRVALNRWRDVALPHTQKSSTTLRFSGSNDLAVAWLATHFDEFAGEYTLKITFTGSLAGLVSLQKGEADIAGSHLWDDANKTYNSSFVKNLFRDEKIALVTLAQRRIGFIVKSGNPLDIQSAADLARPDVRFINRQPGSGTRVYLDYLLRNFNIETAAVRGYDNERNTHSEIAVEIAESRAETGIGLEAAANAYGLDFISLTLERYDLVMRESTYNLAPIQHMIKWLKGEAFGRLLRRLGGYDHNQSGQVEWV